jgi:hypothetical protein
LLITGHCLNDSCLLLCPTSRESCLHLQAFLLTIFFIFGSNLPKGCAYNSIPEPQRAVRSAVYLLRRTFDWLTYQLVSRFTGLGNPPAVWVISPPARRVMIMVLLFHHCDIKTAWCRPASYARAPARFWLIHLSALSSGPRRNPLDYRSIKGTLLRQ